MLKRIVIVLVAIAVVALGVWAYGQHVLASSLAAADEWASILQTEAVLKTGSKPDDWPIRGFLPASLLQSACTALIGAEVVVPDGKAADGRVDGFFHLVIQSATIVAKDVQIGIRLSASVKYSPDRKMPWWSGATANVYLDALLLPISQTHQDGISTTNFRLVPDAISLAAGFGNLDIRIIWGFWGVLAADQLKIALRDQLVLPVPALSPSFDLDATVNSTSFQPFGGVETADSGTNITVTMKRQPQTFAPVAFDRWLLTHSGVWLLGGNRVSPVPGEQPPSAVEISKKLAAIKGQLASFQRSDNTIELSLPSTVFTDFVDRVMQPSPLNLAVTTGQTRGNITDAIIIHNDKVLGNVGLEVRPNGDAFAEAQVVVTPSKSSWSTTGFDLPLSITISGDMNLDVHLATGIGGGIGNTVDLKVGAAAKSIVHASFEEKKVPQGTAIILQPIVPCSPLVIRVDPGTTPAIAEKWVVLSPVGLVLDREIGGMKISPAVLVDGLPVVSKLPTAVAPDGKPILPNLSKTTVFFQKPFFGVTLSPAGVLMDVRGVTIRATASLSLRDSDETDKEKDRRKDLKQALKDSSPEVTCKNIVALKIVGGQATFVDLYGEYVYIGQALKNHLEVGKDTLKLLTDIDPRNTPENLVKLADAVGKAAEYDAQHIWNEITHPPAPPGPTISGSVGGTKVEVHPAGVSVGGHCIGIC